LGREKNWEEKKIGKRKKIGRRKKLGREKNWEEKKWEEKKIGKRKKLGSEKNWEEKKIGKPISILKMGRIYFSETSISTYKLHVVIIQHNTSCLPIKNLIHLVILKLILKLKT
jgi:hypothetical protein